MGPKELWIRGYEAAYAEAIENGMREDDAEYWAADHADEYATDIQADLADYERRTRRENHLG